VLINDCYVHTPVVNTLVSTGLLTAVYASGYRAYCIQLRVVLGLVYTYMHLSKRIRGLHINATNWKRLFFIVFALKTVFKVVVWVYVYQKLVDAYCISIDNICVN